MKPVLLKWISTEVAEVFRCVHTLFNAAQSDLMSYKCIIWRFKHKHWILIFKIIKQMKIDFKSEIESPADGSTSLLTSESLRLNRVI